MNHDPPIFPGVPSENEGTGLLIPRFNRCKIRYPEHLAGVIRQGALNRAFFHSLIDVDGTGSLTRIHDDSHVYIYIYIHSYIYIHIYIYTLYIYIYTTYDGIHVH